MKRPAVIKVLFGCVAVVFVCCLCCSCNRAWPPKDYTEVRAFLYNLDSHDALPLVTNGRLDASVADTNGVRLSDAQVSRLLKAVTGKHPRHESAACYVPHHGYLFLDDQHRIVGWVELSLGCMVYRTSSGAPTWLDIYALQDLTVELGLPVLKKEADYPSLKPKDPK